MDNKELLKAVIERGVESLMHDALDGLVKPLNENDRFSEAVKVLRAHVYAGRAICKCGYDLRRTVSYTYNSVDHPHAVHVTDKLCEAGVI